MEKTESAFAHAMKTTFDILGKLHLMIAAPPKSNNQSEPTIRDTMDSIADLREVVTSLAESMNVGFEKVWGVLSTLQLGQDNLLVEVRDIKRRVVNLEFQFADFQDRFSDLSEAEEKDALASISHEERIVRLEKINNIQAVSPLHLREIE